MHILVARFSGLMYSVSSPQMLNQANMRTQVVRSKNKAQDILSQLQSMAGTHSLTKACTGLSFLLKAQQELLDEGAEGSKQIDRQTLNLARKEFADASQTHARFAQNLRRKYTLGDDECPVSIPGKTHIAATVGEACVAFQQKNYVLARRLLAEAIRAHPRGPASLRVALGYCLYQLGHIEVAKLAFERALQLEPNNHHALVAYGILTESYHGDQVPSQEQQAEILRRARILFEKALEVNKQSAAARNRLSDHYFYQYVPVKARSGKSANEDEPTAVAVSAKKMEYRLKLSAPVSDIKPGMMLRLTHENTVAYFVEVLRAEDSETVLISMPFAGESRNDYTVYMRDLKTPLKFAQRAAECSANNKSRAESHFLAGRAYHAMGNYIDAAAEYRKCNALQKNFYPSLFGLAKCLLHQKKEIEAERMLNDIAKLQPYNGDAHRLLGILYWDRRSRVISNDSTPPPEEVFLECASAIASRKKNKVEPQPNDNVLSNGLPSPTKPEMIDFLTNKAFRACVEGMDVSPKDFRTLLLYAEIQQNMPKKAKKAWLAYDKILKELEKKKQGTPLSLWNNYGVLSTRLGNFEKAKEAFDNALKRGATLLSSSDFDEIDVDLVPEWVVFHPLCLTTSFNISRMEEMRGNLKKAEMSYWMMTRKYPAYIDARLRLAALSMQKGDTRAAEENIKGVLQITRESASDTMSDELRVSNRASALCLYGQLKELEGDWNSASDYYDSVLQLPRHSVDSYAILAQANLKFRDVYRRGLISIGEDPTLNSNIRPAREEILRKAFADYKAVLRYQSRNLFASNGLGCVLAERGRLDQARDVFSLVREADQDVCPATINLAHIFVINGHVNHAIQLYKKALKKFYGGGGCSAVAVESGDRSKVSSAAQGDDMLYLGSSGGSVSQRINIMTCLARGYAEQAEWERAIDVLKSALMIQPDNMQLWYNVAFARVGEVLRVLQLAPTQRESQTVERAFMHLKNALRLFQKLQEYVEERLANDPELQGGGRENRRKIIQKLGFSLKVVKENIKFCETNIPRAEKHVEDARRRDAEKKRVEERRKEELREAEQRREETRRKKEEEERRRREQEQNQARELAMSLQDMQQQWQQDEANKKESEKNRKRILKGASKKKEIDMSVEEMPAIDRNIDLSGPVMLDSRRASFRQAVTGSGMNTAQDDATLVRELFGDEDEEEHDDINEDSQPPSGSENIDLSVEEVESLFRIPDNRALQADANDEDLREIFGDDDEEEDDDDDDDEIDTAAASSSSASNKRAAPEDDQENANAERRKRARQAQVVEDDEDE